VSSSCFTAVAAIVILYHPSAMSKVRYRLFEFELSTDMMSMCVVSFRVSRVRRFTVVSPIGTAAMMNEDVQYLRLAR